MEAHLVIGGKCAPKLLTVATEAKALAAAREGTSEHIIIPDQKTLGIPCLNALLGRAYAAGNTDAKETAAKPLSPTPRLGAPRSMDAGSIISRMDCPGVDVDAMVETIAKSGGAALRRFAGAVALRFAELAEGGR